MKGCAVFFDLDGTLVDSVHDVHLCLNTVLKNYGREELSLPTVTSLVGGGAKIMARKALEITGGVDSISQVKQISGSFLSLYRDNPVRLSKIFPGGIQLLENLNNQGVRLAICTNKPRITTDPVLNYFGLKKYFSMICCGDEVPHQKPDGRHITGIITEMALKPEKVVMVGDSDNDILASSDAGVRSIAVTYGYDKNVVNLPELDLLAHSLFEIELLLEDIWLV